MRNTLDTIQVGRDLSGVHDLVPDDAQFFCSGLRVLQLVPDGDAEHVEPVTVIGLIHVLEIGHLGLAGAAPGGPEINQHVLALADVIGEPNSGRFRILRILYDGEIHEMRALGGFDLGFEGRFEGNDFGKGLHLLGQTVQEAGQLVGLLHVHLGKGDKGQDIVGIGFDRLNLVIVKLADGLVVVGLCSVLVVAESGHLFAVVGHELLHPFVIGPVTGVRSLLVGGDGGTRVRVYGDGGTVGDERNGRRTGIDDSHCSQIGGDDGFETAVLDIDGGVQGFTHRDLHELGGILAERSHHLGGLAGFRGTGGQQRHGGGQISQLFHIVDLE